jgi:hypothetical protein
MRTGLGWRSLDPVEAVAAVHEIKTREELYRVVEQAMHPEARRMALLRLGDKNLMARYAEWDPSPIVRRRMVRELDDEALVQRIAESDPDSSVKDSAYSRLRQLRRT